MRPGLLALLVLSLGIAIGVAGPILLSEPPRTAGISSDTRVSSSSDDAAGGDGSSGVRATAKRLDRLSAELAEERKARTELAAEVASLKNELNRLQAVPVSHDVRSRRASEARQANGGGAPGRPGSLDVDALVDAGFSEQTVRDFKDRMDQMELDRLYLRDIATREGWLNTQRFREETEALRLDAGSTREEYGEEFYDWMLYTTGHPNRVSVGGVMGGSAAEDVGLRPGDVVVSYDDERIFSPSELRDATIGGEAGALTPVEVLRDGRRMRLTVPRGPLGIRVDHENVEPQRQS